MNWMSPQTNQEAFAVDTNETHLLPGTTTARGSDKPEFREESIGAGPRWRGCDRDGFDPPIQPLPAYHV